MGSKYTVYCHTNKINGKRYVGITSVKPEYRWRNGLGYEKNKHFFGAIQKYGWEEFSHEILFTGLTAHEASEKEKYLIKKWNLLDDRYGYNLSSGGLNAPIDDVRGKMSKAQKGEKGFWYGKKLSEETKHKMSLRKKGRIPKSSPPKPVIWVDKGIIFPSLTEASKGAGISPATVHKLCNHQNKRKNAFHFEYYTGEPIWEKS